MIDDLLLHLTGENDIPVIGFAFDRTGFYLTYQRICFLPFGHFYLDGTDFREADPVIPSQRKARLWERKRFIAPVPMKPGIAGGLSLLDAPKECLVCLIHAPQNILQDLGVDLVVLWPDLFDLWKLCSLLIVMEGVLGCDVCASHLIVAVRVPLDRQLVALTSFLERSIVELPGPVQRPLQLFCLLLIRVQAVLVSFQLRHASGSRYTVDWPRAVLPQPL